MAVQQEKMMKKEMGIPQHFGLFFAMGLALIMEGIMSACYHVCPNYSNFQFGMQYINLLHYYKSQKNLLKWGSPMKLYVNFHSRGLFLAMIWKKKYALNIFMEVLW